MKCFDKQPTRYDTQESLIEWLEWDLYQQRLMLALEQSIIFDKTQSDEQIAKFLKPKINEAKLELNISSKTDQTIIDFDFNFNGILASINIDNNINNIINDNLESVCPYTINCNKIQFNREVYFSGTTFGAETNFSNTTFLLGADFSGTIFGGSSNFLRTIFNSRDANFWRAIFEKEANFSNAVFDCGVNFLGSVFESNVYFSSSTFGGEVNFSSGSFEGNTYFSSSSFGSSTNFSRSIFGGVVNFSSATFESSTYFSSSTFGGEVNFLMSTFNGGESNFSRSTFEDEIDFTDSIFCGNVNFSRSGFEKGVNFSGCTLVGNVDFSGGAFSENINFSDSIFRGNVNFSRSKFEKEVNFSVETFDRDVDFSGGNFEANVIFTDSIFGGKSDFSRSTFEQDVYFSRSTFNGELDFSTTTFNGESKFSEVHFYQDARFFQVKLNGTSIFNNIVLTPQKSYIKFSSINYNNDKKNFTHINKRAKIKIIKTVIKGRIEFNNVKISEIDFKDSDVDSGGIINRINFEAEPSNWQTASLLKHEATLRDNVIEALEYKKIEKNKHTVELCKNILGISQTHISLSKKLQYIPEFVSLLISKLSNNHGQNWIQAVIFTAVSGFLFFSLAYRYIDDTSISDISTIFTNQFLKEYCNYLIPVNIDLLRGVKENVNWLFYPFYMLGKISVGYGMVEVVQAFRKFSTKGS